MDAYPSAVDKSLHSATLEHAIAYRVCVTDALGFACYV